MNRYLGHDPENCLAVFRTIMLKRSAMAVHSSLVVLT